MKIISTKVHGVLDYATGVLLLITAWLIPSNGDAFEAAQWVPATLGIMTIVMSFLTNYELGLAKLLSMRIHLSIDLLSGVALAISPWLFGFSDKIYLPHVIIGIMEIGVVLLSNPVPYQRPADKRSGEISYQ